MAHLTPMSQPDLPRLLSPFLPQASLSPRQLRQVSDYLALLLKWNAKINLTSVRQPEAIITRHFGESFFLAAQLFPDTNLCRPEPGPANDSGPREGPAVPPPAALDPSTAVGSYQGTASAAPKAARFDLSSRAKREEAQRPNAQSRDLGFPSQPATSHQRPAPSHALDLGSGAGFPGLPLAIYAPQVRLTLVESQAKKAAFLREVVRALTLTNVNVFHGRAESLLPSPPARRKSSPAGSSAPVAADLVSLRAVERFADSLPLAARLLAPAGRLALLIGAAQAAVARKLLPEFTWQPAIPIPLSDRRILLVGSRDRTFAATNQVGQ